MTAEAFIEYVKKECKYYGVKCILRPVKYLVTEGERVSGYFDHEGRELRVAMKHPNALQIMAHEFCHLRQWIEKAPAWVYAQEIGSYDEYHKMLEGKPFDRELHLSAMRDLELDNEKRTVALIKELDLPMDTKRYIKGANAYVMFYNYLKISGKWCTPPNTPYTNKRLVAAMPATFSLNYTKLPKRLEKIFREEGI